MKALIVFAHPGENSFAHEILARTKAALDQAGIPFQVRDLYRMNFQPVFSAADMQSIEAGKITADIEEEQELLIDADLLVMVYPIWWWSQPAILKGWIDRVFTDGFAFRYEQHGPVGLLRNKQALVFTSTRESAAEMQEKGFDKVISKQIVEGILSFVGYQPVIHKNFAAVSEDTNQARADMLKEVEETIARLVQPATV